MREYEKGDVRGASGKWDREEGGKRVRVVSTAEIKRKKVYTYNSNGGRVRAGSLSLSLSLAYSLTWKENEHISTHLSLSSLSLVINSSVVE